MKDPARGFSLLELIVALCLILIFAGVLAERIQAYQKLAESYNIKETASELTAALRIATLNRLAAGKKVDSTWFSAVNPLSLIDLPSGIDGGLWNGDGRTGRWYYYPSRQELLYVFHYNNFLDRLLDHKKIVRFRIIGAYNAHAALGRANSPFVRLIPLPAETLSEKGVD
ncbi:MAG: type II secretion system protein [Pseudomonadota bacterium]|nr:type II secretion system protein [Pseudomonadota bacterium]